MKTVVADHDEISPVYEQLEWPRGYPGSGKPWWPSWDRGPRARRTLVSRMIDGMTRTLDRPRLLAMFRAQEAAPQRQASRRPRRIRCPAPAA